MKACNFVANLCSKSSLLFFSIFRAPCNRKPFAFFNTKKSVKMETQTNTYLHCWCKDMLIQKNMFF